MGKKKKYVTAEDGTKFPVKQPTPGWKHKRCLIGYATQINSKFSAFGGYWKDNTVCVSPSSSRYGAIAKKCSFVIPIAEFNPADDPAYQSEEV